MFYDDAHLSLGVTIKAVQIDIAGGTVYRSSHIAETNINIERSTIQTNQLSTGDTNGL